MSYKLNNNKKFEFRQAYILTLIQSASAEEPIKQAELASITGMDLREVRRAVENLRRSGCKICSSRDPLKGGYWIARNDAEVDTWRRTSQREALSILKTIGRMNGNPDQIPLPGLEGV